MSKPSAFILTGSFLVVCRAPLYFEELARRGLRILLITPANWREQAEAAQRDPAHPSSVIDDIAYVAGSVDREGSFTSGVVAAVRAWQQSYTIVGAYAVGETLVEPTGVVADALGLAGPGLRATRASRSKYLQRLYLPEFSPPSVVLPAGSRDTVPAVEFPAVVKPATRHSSSGVVTVTDEAALRAQLSRYPEHETVLVERKISGPEFSVETLTQHGRTLFSSVTSKRTTESEHDSSAFVELAHTVSGEYGPAQQTVLAANHRMLATLAVRDGITHAEWRIGEDGRAYLMEVAARTPGDGIGLLYQLAAGQPFEPELIRIALGEPATYPVPSRHARQVYLHQLGVLDDVAVDLPGISPQWIGDAGLWPDVKSTADDPATLRAVLVHKERGSTLGPLLSSEDRAVSFLIDAPTGPELDELEARVRAAITIRLR